MIAFLFLYINDFYLNMNRRLIKKFNKLYINSIAINKIMQKRYEEANEQDFEIVREAVEEITILTEELYNDLNNCSITQK